MRIFRASGCIRNLRKFSREKPPASLVNAYNRIRARGTNTKNNKKTAYGKVQFLLRPKNEKTFLTTSLGI
jgi:hypothetical protein